MAVDRKQQMKEITERLEQGVKDIFTSEMYTTYLRTMAKFHNYSFNNTLLIAMQRPDATLVAGFNAWNPSMNYLYHRTFLCPVPYVHKVGIRGKNQKFPRLRN